MKRISQYRNKIMILIVLLCAFGLPLSSQAEQKSDRPCSSVSTFSITARDSVTGELGIAVASRFFAVGSVVPWAKADVGAVATQSFANTSFGWRGLELLAKGATPDETVDILLRTEPLIFVWMTIRSRSRSWDGF